MIDLDQLDSAFVHTEYREGQRECLEFAISAINSGKKFIILECPTGSGKSAIAMTLANLVSSSYYLTSTKILQDQIAQEFPDIVTLKGRNTYRCTFHDRYGQKLVDKKIMTAQQVAELKNVGCDSGFCKTPIHFAQTKRHYCSKCFVKDPQHVLPWTIPNGDLKQLPDGYAYSACPYYDSLYMAMAGPQVSMNFSSFIYQTMMAGRFQNERDLLIIDESHNTESQIMNFINITISDTMLTAHNLKLPVFESAQQYRAWFDDTNLLDIIEELQAQAEAKPDSTKADEYSRLLFRLKFFYEQINSSPDNWVAQVEQIRDSKGRHTGLHRVIIKPVFIDRFVPEIISCRAKHVILLSATILDVGVMSRSLGLDDVAAYRMRNRFPVENRPIIYSPAAKMTGGRDKMAQWMPKMVSAIEKILEKHEGERGIIHTHSNAIMQQIIAGVKPKLSKRLTSQLQFPDKNLQLQYHASVPDSVLIAPAMHEGIDLKDDLSRFQIICKIPYANFYDDVQLAKRIEVDGSYYTWLTSLKLVQSYGRSIRSKDDKAVTYIIDESFSRFRRDASRMLPVWFTEAIID